MKLTTRLFLLCFSLGFTFMQAAPVQNEEQLQELKTKLGHLRSVLDQLSAVIDAKEEAIATKEVELQKVDDRKSEPEGIVQKSDEVSDGDEDGWKLKDKLLSKLSPEDMEILKKFGYKGKFLDELDTESAEDEAEVEVEEEAEEVKRDEEDEQDTESIFASLSEEDQNLLKKLNSKLKLVEEMKNAGGLASQENEDDNLEDALSSLPDAAQKNRKDARSEPEVPELHGVEDQISNLELAVKLYKQRLAENAHPIKEKIYEGVFGPFPDVPAAAQERSERSFEGEWEDESIPDEDLGSDGESALDKAVKRLLGDIAYARKHKISLSELMSAIQQQNNGN